MTEMFKSDHVNEKRKQLIRERGFWICEKCGTKYYAGINCDTCLSEEFIQKLKKVTK
jgi:hypothetical protein